MSCPLIMRTIKLCTHYLISLSDEVRRKDTLFFIPTGGLSHSLRSFPYGFVVRHIWLHCLILPFSILFGFLSPFILFVQRVWRCNRKVKRNEQKNNFEWRGGKVGKRVGEKNKMSTRISVVATNNWYVTQDPKLDTIKWRETKFNLSFDFCLSDCLMSYPCLSLCLIERTNLFPVAKTPLSTCFSMFPFFPRVTFNLRKRCFVVKGNFSLTWIWTTANSSIEKL